MEEFIMQHLRDALVYFGLTCTVQDVIQDPITNSNVKGLLQDAIDELKTRVQTATNEELVTDVLSDMLFYANALYELEHQEKVVLDVVPDPGPESQTDVPGGLLAGDEDVAMQQVINVALVSVMMEYAEYNGRAAINSVRGATPMQYLRMYYDETYVPDEVASAFIAVWYDLPSHAAHLAEYRSWEHPNKPV
jgi:hypothetical protein